jgi:porin
MPFQLEVNLHPDERNELFVKLGFAVDNGLNDISPWALTPWAVDLEDDVEDINGRSRDYLLTAWYKHTLLLGEDASLGATVGIIDATAYLDANVYANDEFTQFMNEVFVNAGPLNLSSYDAGGALELVSGPWSLNAVAMNLGENDDGNSFNFWGIQAGYAIATSLREGNYRLTVTGTSSDFLDPEGSEEESLLACGLSFDQELGETVGAFLRLSWQEEDAAVDYKALYSGGLDFNGRAWGRDGDNIGIGYAYLDGGNGDIDHSQVFEAYYRAALNEYFAITADVQYMSDDRDQVAPGQEDPQGWIFGLRLTAAF